MNYFVIILAVATVIVLERCRVWRQAHRANKYWIIQHRNWD